jgi:hypothetical protein
MGLKGYRLWVMCQLDSNVQSPTTGRAAAAAAAAARGLHRVGTLHVESSKLTHNP